MRNGKAFRTFIETLSVGDVIKIYSCETVQIHHPSGTRLDFYIWCDEEDLFIERCEEIVDDIIDGALQLRGLTLSDPIIVDKQGNLLPPLTDDGRYWMDLGQNPGISDDAWKERREKQLEIDERLNSTRVEYCVIKLEEEKT